jgi:demethylsterigmatocystin 6-O-methyltransferase
MKSFELISPSFMAFPRFLRENGYKNPTDPSNCPWHLGHQTTESPFAWLQSHPQAMDYFLPWMATNREGLSIFLDAYPYRDHLQNTNSEVPLFVDIGGAMGHQTTEAKKRIADIPGRVVLQDLPPVIEQVKDNLIAGVEAMPYDFFTPQPVSGARIYYMRNILHDWPNDKCKEILQNTASAMTPDSVLLIDDMVLPEVGAPWRATQLDMAMITCLAATERTESQWRDLFEESGMKIVKIVQYSEECQECVIAIVPK